MLFFVLNLYYIYYIHYIAKTWNNYYNYDIIKNNCKLMIIK